jgi:hypothetical protein
MDAKSSDQNSSMDQDLAEATCNAVSALAVAGKDKEGVGVRTLTELIGAGFGADALGWDD